MRLIAIDTALEACSVAAVDLDSIETAVVRSLPMARGHAEALVPLLAEVVALSGGFGSVDRIAVTTGPGSFTGIRVGLSAARGLALAISRQAVGVSTLAVLAAPFLENASGLPVGAAIDAKHGRIYFQMFAPGGRTLVAARCAPAREAARSAGVGPIIVVGSGAVMFAEAAASVGSQVRLGDPAAAIPDVLWVARIGSAAAEEGVPPRPLYLRPPDARPQDSGRIARQ